MGSRVYGLVNGTSGIYHFNVLVTCVLQLHPFPIMHDAINSVVRAAMQDAMLMVMSQWHPRMIQAESRA